MNFNVGKKLYKLSKLGEGGGEVIWTKSKRTAVFPRATVPNHSIIPTTTITLTDQVIFEEHKFRIRLLGLVFN